MYLVILKCMYVIKYSQVFHEFWNGFTHCIWEQNMFMLHMDCDIYDFFVRPH